MDPTAHQTITLNDGADLQGFRQALRVLTWSDIPPEQITWVVRDDAAELGDQPPAPYGVAGKPIILPRVVGELIRQVVCHRDAERYARLYDLVWRMRRPKDPEPYLIADTGDLLVQRLNGMAEDVASDIRRMRKEVRFREVNDPAVGERFVAWFEPEHYVVEAAAPLFVDRFPSLDWTILTPKGSLWWDRKELAVGPPAQHSDAPEADALGIGWRPYYESTFNPPRSEMAHTRRHLQRKPWRGPPEAQAARSS